jgi:type I restriction enzyme S subunit
MSADTSIGEIPDSWQKSELGKVAKWGSGGTPKSGTSAFYGGEIPWAVIGDLTESWVIDTAQTITKEGLEKSSAKIIEPGTVMLAMYGASIGRTGIAAVKMATNQAIAFAVPVEGIVDNQFLLKYLQSQKEIFVRAGQGGAQPNISQTVIKPWPIPLPPIAEQIKIIEILEEQLSHLDVALASVRTARVKAARFRRSLLHAAFSGALTRHDLSDGELPEGWRKSTIAEVADVVGGRTPTKFEQRLADTESPNRRVPFYKVGDMNSSMRFLSESRVYFAESEASEFGIEILKSGTVIFPKAGGAIATNKKRILELPGAIDLNCMGITANGVLHERLLYWFFESFNLSSIADGTVLPQINKKKVSALEIAFPIGKDEQAKLLDEIEAEISKSEAVVQVVDEVGKKCLALRRSLLHAAFSGDLTKEWREDANV